MSLAGLPPPSSRFTPRDAADALIRDACRAHPDVARCETIGLSVEGRPLLGVTLGRGPRVVTLVAGAHADEPVGPETLLTLIVQGLAEPDVLGPLLDRFTFRIVPHVNPEGAARNARWADRWGHPDESPETLLAAFLAHKDREPPGRDVEFGYPVMRPENAAASRFLFPYTPVALHVSLHGMAFSEGALLLIERRWADRVDGLMSGWREAAKANGLRLHDHDRGGEKGFLYLGPGFHATPEGTAMRAHFEQQGDPATAAKFFLSSMELAVLTGRSPATGETPLCLVTELPLFVIGNPLPPEPGVPRRYLDLLDRLPEWTLAAHRGAPLADAVADFGLRPLSVEGAVHLQLLALSLGLAAVEAPA